MKEPSMPEIILAYFKLEEKSKSLINDIEYAKISKNSAVIELQLYDELYTKLLYELWKCCNLYKKINNIRAHLRELNGNLKTYYGCKKNTVNTEANQTCEDEDESKR